MSNIADSDDRSDPAELPIVWGLFTRLELAPEGKLEEVWDYARAAQDEIGFDGMDRGWHLVAAKLRQYLKVHAAKLGCDCGSAEWLQREQVHHAEWAANEPGDPFEGQSDG